MPTKPMTTEEAPAVLAFKLANTEALFDECAGRLLDAEAASAGAQDWADGLFDTIRSAHTSLLAVRNATTFDALRDGLAETVETLGRILDPTSEDIGEVS
jgi:hypothetical protein